MVLREEMDETEEAERTTAVDPELTELVSGLSRDELEQIVLHQAQSDRRFALMLRAEYSSKPTDRATASELRSGNSRYRAWSVLLRIPGTHGNQGRSSRSDRVHR